MNTEYLVEMANRIGEFFEAYPDHSQSEREIAEHLKKFWEPRMRRALLTHVEEHQGVGLEPLVLAAVQQHRELLMPIAPASAIPPAVA
jgi:formate dehydrogenase subunit delta